MSKKFDRSNIPEELHFSYVPENQWAVADPDSVGRWATVSVDDTAVGTLYTDDQNALSYITTVPNPVGTQMSQQVLGLAGGPMGATRAYESILRWAKNQNSVSIEESQGILSSMFLGDDSTTTYSISVDENSPDKVVALTYVGGDQPEVRENGEWKQVSEDDPRIVDIPFHSVSEEAIELWDSGHTNLNDYAGVRLD